MPTATLLAVVVAFSAGCGSGQGDSERIDPSPHVSVSDLDVGSFTTSPGKIGSPNPARARIMEGQRLGSVAPLAMEIDPRFKFQTGVTDSDVHAWLDPSIAGIDSENLDDDTKGFIAGYYTWGRSEKDLGIAQTISYSVLLFTDQDSATRAARSLYDRTLSDHIHGSPEMDFQPVSIDGRPDTLAYWVPGEEYLHSYTPHGRFVIYSSVSDGAKNKLHEESRAELTELTTKSLAVITPAIDRFTSTPPEQLATAPVDHDNLLGRTLRRSPTDSAKDAPGFYDRHAALHMSSDPGADAELFAATGMDWMASNGSRLYRAKDAAAAQKLLVAHSSPEKLDRLVGSPKNLPWIRCYEYRGDDYGRFRFRCYLRYDEYVSEVSSNQLIDVHQRASAQYAILENSN
ncbi:MULTISPECIES: hypothetical protein [Nocardia]|uniref:DUF7373 family lipoprotein n=1 Tax=Nocardia TaxID=1817 RepID=UPI0012D7C02D|nr:MULTISPECIES: hypothetical protein [Nocardia]MBF6272442.1 hypothetical protein [Nocardia nova]